MRNLARLKMNFCSSKDTTMKREVKMRCVTSAMRIADRGTAPSTYGEIPHVSKTTTNNTIEQWSPKCGPWALGVPTTSSSGPQSKPSPRLHYDAICLSAVLTSVRAKRVNCWHLGKHGARAAAGGRCVPRHHTLG